MFQRLTFGCVHTGGIGGHIGVDPMGEIMGNDTYFLIAGRGALFKAPFQTQTRERGGTSETTPAKPVIHLSLQNYFYSPLLGSIWGVVV